MSDVRTSFPTTEDSLQNGVPLRSVQQGDSVATKAGQLAFAFQDNSNNAIAAPVKTAGQAVGNAVPVLPASDGTNGQFLPLRAAGVVPPTVGSLPVMAFLDASGNLVFPQLNAAGQIPVTSDVVSNDLSNQGVNLTGSATEVTIATITLTASKTYRRLEAVVSCFRDAIYTIYQNNNGTLTALAYVLCGPGQFSVDFKMEGLTFTAGATGTQQLLLKALNQDALSALRGTIAIAQQ